MSHLAACSIRVTALLWVGMLASSKAAEPFPIVIATDPSPGSGITLNWSGAGPDWAYTVQSRPSLSDGVWLTRSDQRPWPITGLEWTNSLDGPTRFYQVLAVPVAERGRLLEFSHLAFMTLPEIAIFLDFADIPVTPLYEVNIYRAVYETVDPWGGRTRASGAVVIPSGVDRPLPLMSYQHGTLILTNEAPSVLNEQILPGVGFASIGYAVSLPDLLGLGESPGLHPYHHARSEATAGVDALRALRVWCAGNAVDLSGQLFLIGYSQGGHATMALHRELESYHADEFVVTASAPMAGAYDLSGVTADDLLSGRPMPNPYYLIYLLAAYQEVYGLTNGLAALLAPPFDAILPPLMNGNTPSLIINDAINDATREDARLILDPVLLAGMQTEPQHPIRVALRDNDLYNWTPVAPTRLYHCRGDQDVTFANSEVAYASFHNRGADHVQLIDPDSAADHGGCVLPAFILAKDWFETLRHPPHD